MGNAAVRFLRSPGLALTVLFALALLAAAGTAPRSGGDNGNAGGMYGGPLFSSLWVLLVVNIVLCTIHRHRARRGRRPTRRGLAIDLGDLLLHLSIVLIVAGMVVKGLFGTVGTQNIRVGERTDTMYDWSAKDDVAIGFGVGIRARASDFYPAQARIALKIAATGEKVGLVELTEGKRTAVPASPLWLELRSFDRAAGAVSLAAGDGAQQAVLTLGTGAPERASRPFGTYVLTLNAYRQELRGISAEVAILEGERLARTAQLAVNERVSHRGTSLYLTAWGEDPEGKPFVGIQFTRDPGAPFFWAGSIVLLAGLPLFLVARHWRGPAGTQKSA